MKPEIAILHLNSDNLIKIRTLKIFQLFSMLLNIMLKQQKYIKGFLKLCCLSRVLQFVVLQTNRLVLVKGSSYVFFCYYVN